MVVARSIGGVATMGGRGWPPRLRLLFTVGKSLIMSVPGDCLSLEDGVEVDESGWVESELERELAGLAHLTLQDLEEEEEEKSGFHGNKEVRHL